MSEINFGRIRKTALLLRSKLENLPVPAAAIRDEMARLLPGVKAVSFDVFDTLTARRIYHPVDVFRYLEFHPAFRALGPLPEPAGALRFKAEQAARTASHQQLGTGEVLLADIYEVFCRMAKIDRAQASALRAAEEEVEIELAIPNEGGRTLFEQAEASGKPLLFISDTYHHPEFLLRLLRHCGYPAEESQLYCSSQHKMSKGEGKLFALVLRARGLHPAEVLHIGDNPHSDRKVPASIGMPALWHPFRAYKDEIPRYFSGPSAPMHAWVRSLTAREGIPAAHGKDEFWNRIGYAALGPLLAGFALWLKREFEARKIDRAYFLLRDGVVFHRVYEMLVGAASPCPTRTMPSSRRAMIFPLFGGDAGLVVPQLLCGVGTRPVGEYLSRVGVDPAPFAEEFRRAGFSGPDDPVDARIEFRKVFDLIGMPRIIDAMAAAARPERENLVAYLVQEGLFAPGRAALVDLGWHGTIHKGLHSLARAHSPRTALHGCYLATFSGMSENLPPDLGFSSYLVHLSQPENVNRILSTTREILEIFCSSPEGSLVSFRREGERIVPLLKEADVSPEQAAHILAVHDGAVRFASDFKAGMERYGWTEIPAEIASENFLRLQSDPTKEEALRVGALCHGENWGTTRAQPIAAFRETSAEPADLWDDYRTAYWKNGLMNLPTAQAAALRTLTWMMQP